MRALTDELGIADTGRPSVVWGRLREFDAVRAAADQHLPAWETRKAVEHLERVREVTCALCVMLYARKELDWGAPPASSAA